MASVAAPVYGGYHAGYGVSKVVTPAVTSVAAPVYGGYGSYGAYGVSKVVSPVSSVVSHGYASPALGSYFCFLFWFVSFFKFKD